jgi:hypothetical protein
MNTTKVKIINPKLIEASSFFKARVLKEDKNRQQRKNRPKHNFINEYLLAISKLIGYRKARKSKSPLPNINFKKPKSTQKNSHSSNDSFLTCLICDEKTLNRKKRAKHWKKVRSISPTSQTISRYPIAFRRARGVKLARDISIKNTMIQGSNNISFLDFPNLESLSPEQKFMFSKLKSRLSENKSKFLVSPMVLNGRKHGRNGVPERPFSMENLREKAKNLPSLSMNNFVEG